MAKQHPYARVVDGLKTRCRKNAEALTLLQFDWPVSRFVLERISEYITDHICADEEPVIYEIIEEVPHELLDEREIYWIKYYNSLAPNGYNCSSGGNSKKELSDLLDMDDGSLRRIESGRTNPTTTTLLKVAKAFEISVSELLDFDY